VQVIDLKDSSPRWCWWRR